MLPLFQLQLKLTGQIGGGVDGGFGEGVGGGVGGGVGSEVGESDSLGREESVGDDESGGTGSRVGVGLGVVGFSQLLDFLLDLLPDHQSQPDHKSEGAFDTVGEADHQPSQLFFEDLLAEILFALMMGT